MIDLPPLTPPRKRSVTIAGHATSVSLEDAFWTGLRRIAAEDGLALSALVAELDRAKPPQVGLATAIRLFVLARAGRPPSAGAGAGEGQAWDRAGTGPT